MLNFLRASSKKRDKGFTLLEVLVVIAILGMIASIVIPNVTNFMHSGRVESANTELHNVRLAIQSYSYDYNTTNINGSVGSDGSSTGTLNESVGVYILDLSQAQALYFVVNGKISNATPNPDGKWNGLSWDSYRWQ